MLCHPRGGLRGPGRSRFLRPVPTGGCSSRRRCPPRPTSTLGVLVQSPCRIVAGPSIHGRPIASGLRRGFAMSPTIHGPTDRRRVPGLRGVPGHVRIASCFASWCSCSTPSSCRLRLADVLGVERMSDRIRPRWYWREATFAARAPLAFVGLPMVARGTAD